MADSWRDKLAEGAKFSQGDVLEIAKDVLGDEWAVKKQADIDKEVSEAGRKYRKLAQEVEDLGGEELLKFAKDHKDDFAEFRKWQEWKKSGEKGDKSPEVMAIEELRTEIKSLKDDQKKQTTEFQKDLKEEKTRTRISMMLTGAAQEGIILDDAFIKIDESVMAELVELVDAPDEEFGKLLGDKVVLPGLDRQNKLKEKLGVVSAEEVVVPGATPGPKGSMFDRSIGRTGEEEGAEGGESWVGNIGTDLIRQRYEKGQGAAPGAGPS